jgi:hypothetical protein
MVAMRLYRVGVDEHEGETGRLVAAITPGMIGAALDECPEPEVRAHRAASSIANIPATWKPVRKRAEPIN